MAQKTSFTFGGVTVQTALGYEKNYREKSPVVALVVEGNNIVSPDDLLLCHHNAFYLPSPYHVGGDLFAIPASNILFAKVRIDGDLFPIYGNVICSRVQVETPIPLPPEQIKTHINRSLVIEGGITPYKKGDLIFHRPYANYEIVYHFNGEQKRVVKVHSEQIVGFSKDTDLKTS